MSETAQSLSGRIEGGIDAIVIGAGVEGLAASALLGRAGFKTVLVDSAAEFGGAIAKRHFPEGGVYDDGEHLVWRLDPALAEELDLYRLGVSFAARRLDTVYVTGAGAVFSVDGDLLRAAAAAPPEASAAIEDIFRLAGSLAPVLRQCGGETRGFRQALGALTLDARLGVDAMIASSTLDFIDGRMVDSAFGSAIAAEAAFRASASPSEAYSLFSLVDRWSGEASGLQGGVAYPDGGASAVVAAIRRAAQSAAVDIRASTHVSSIIIERDRVAGVSLDHGGQLRAPIVVSAIDAQTTFGALIGPAHLDPEFSAYKQHGPQVTSAMLHARAELHGAIDRLEGEGVARYLYAPRSASLEAAFAAARRGEVPREFVLEVIFPDRLQGDRKLVDERISIIAHPAPLWAKADVEERDALERAIIDCLGKVIPDAANLIRQTALRTAGDFADASGRPVSAQAAPPVFARQWARIGVLTGANRIGGLYFCGPEAQLAAGISGAAGRAAARRAIAAANKGELA